MRYQVCITTDPVPTTAFQPYQLRRASGLDGSNLNQRQHDSWVEHNPAVSWTFLTPIDTTWGERPSPPPPPPSARCGIMSASCKQRRVLVTAGVSAAKCCAYLSVCRRRAHSPGPRWWRSRRRPRPPPGPPAPAAAALMTAPVSAGRHCRQLGRLPAASRPGQPPSPEASARPPAAARSGAPSEEPPAGTGAASPGAADCRWRNRSPAVALRTPSVPLSRLRPGRRGAHTWGRPAAAESDRRRRRWGSAPGPPSAGHWRRPGSSSRHSGGDEWPADCAGRRRRPM